MTIPNGDSGWVFEASGLKKEYDDGLIVPAILSTQEAWTFISAALPVTTDILDNMPTSIIITSRRLR